MDLSPILARMKAQLSGFKMIGSAVDLESLTDSLVPSPACYLLPMSESAEDSELIGGFEQRLSVGFTVILVVRNIRDTSGAAASIDLEALRTQLKTALLNWAPEPAVGEPVNFTGGKLLSFTDGLLWWADEFRVITYLRTS